MTTPASPQIVGVQLFTESDLTRNGHLLRRLRACLGHRDIEANAADGDWNCEADQLSDKVVAVLVAPRDRRRAIRIAEEIGRLAAPPPILLVVGGLTPGEYDILVNRGAVRYVYDPADSADLILCGLYAATRTRSTLAASPASS